MAAGATVTCGLAVASITAVADKHRAAAGAADTNTPNIRFARVAAGSAVTEYQAAAEPAPPFPNNNPPLPPSAPATNAELPSAPPLRTLFAAGRRA